MPGRRATTHATKGSAEKQLRRLTACIDRGLNLVRGAQAKVRLGVKKIRAVADTLDPANGSVDERRHEFEERH